MTKKYLFAVVLLVSISLLSLFSALKHINSKSVKEALGAYTFAETKSNLFKLGKIKLIDENQNEITLYYDSAWFIEEAADYLAAESAMRTFYDIVRGATLVKDADYLPNNAEFMNIKTYDTEGNLLDDVFISKENPQIIKYAGAKNFYVSDMVEKLSFYPADWLPYPLFSVVRELVSALSVDGNYAAKETLDELSNTRDDLRHFFALLQNIEYTGIVAKDVFAEENPEAPAKEILLYLIGGLNFRLHIYKLPDGYYMEIMPERELIAKAEVNDIISLKQMYYDGWIFRLDDEQGEFLYGFKL